MNMFKPDYPCNLNLWLVYFFLLILPFMKKIAQKGWILFLITLCVLCVLSLSNIYPAHKLLTKDPDDYRNGSKLDV